MALAGAEGGAEFVLCDKQLWNICLALRNVLSSCNLQLPSPGVSPSTSWEILSGMVDAEQLGRIVQPPLPLEAVLSYVNTLSRSQMSPGNKYWLL